MIYKTKMEMLVKNHGIDDFLRPRPLESPMQGKLLAALLVALQTSIEEDYLDGWSFRDGLYYRRPESRSYEFVFLVRWSGQRGYSVIVSIPDESEGSVNALFSKEELAPFFVACDEAGLAEYLINKISREARERLEKLSLALDEVLLP